MATIAKNLATVRRRVAGACARVARDPSSVTLVAVTKTVTPAEVRELYALGMRDFGENRVVDGLRRVEALDRDDARWHLIGHLQRNKAAAALAGFRCIHSVESPKLIDVLDRECGIRNLKANILIEVNVSGEDSKYGISPRETAALVEKAARAPNLDVRGLMTMAPFTDDPETARPVFQELRKLRDCVEAESGVMLPELSMGMSGDFEVAVEEGATMIRVGNALFA